MSSVVVRLQGGLGNQLFQYARGLALANESQSNLFFDYRLLYQDLSKEGRHRREALKELGLSAQEAPGRFLFASRAFNFLESFPRVASLSKRILTNHFFGFEIERRFSYSAGPPINTRLLYVEGYWQSPKYFGGMEEEIRSAILQSKTGGEKFRRLHRQISEKHSACVHVRRGDYLRHPHVNFHGVLDAQYYERGASYLKQNFDIDTFYIFSDDPNWCEKNLKLSEKQVIIANEDYPVTAGNDLRLLAAGKYFIISNSSFSWWGAWLANASRGRVVAPARWFINADIITTDLFPAGWKLL